MNPAYCLAGISAHFKYLNTVLKRKSFSITQGRDKKENPYSKAAIPVISMPVISRCISCVPS
jgi:hypothetical protein